MSDTPERHADMKRTLLADPGQEMYGLQICTEAGLPSGTIYPILARLECLGWLESRWEDTVARDHELDRARALDPAHVLALVVLALVVLALVVLALVALVVLALVVLALVVLALVVLALVVRDLARDRDLVRPIGGLA